MDIIKYNTVVAKAQIRQDYYVDDSAINSRPPDQRVLFCPTLFGYTWAEWDRLNVKFAIKYILVRLSVLCENGCVDDSFSLSKTSCRAGRSRRRM